MATYYSQGSGNWSTLANWNTEAGGGGSSPASVAAMDDQGFVIQEGHSVCFDVDTSGFANGIAGVTITGSAAGTPGMLYAKHDADGTYHLKLKTGTKIQGTNAAIYGRLLANSDGVWGHDGDLPFGRKFIIDLADTAYIDAQYLDIALYDTEPGILSVQTYGTKSEVSSIDPGTDVITCSAAHGWSQGTPVMVRSSGDLPGGLTATDVYYVRSPSGADLKLALQNNDSTLVDLTSAGTGTIEIFSGHTNTGTATMNVLEDVTGDPQWLDGASVVLVDCNAPEPYDQQRVTISGAPAAGTITLSANVDSAQYPGARIYLMTRNVAIRSATTSITTSIVSYASGSTHGGVFQCEIRSTAGTGATFYGYGVNAGSGHTVSGTVSGCYYGFYGGSGHTISGTVSGCYFGFNGGSGHTISGTVSGCTYGVDGGSGHTISGTVSGCYFGINYGSDHIVTETGVIAGCWTGIYRVTRATLAGRVYGNGTDIEVQFSSSSQNTIVSRGAIVTVPSLVDRNAASGLFPWQGLYCEDYGGVLGASYAYLVNGDVIRNDVTVRPGGASSSIEVVPQSHCSVACPLPIFEWTEHAVPASEQTRSIYVLGNGWTSFPTNAELWFEAAYLNDAVKTTRAVIRSTEALVDNVTWTELSVTFTPAQAGLVRYRAWLAKYEAGASVFIDNMLVTS